MRRRAATFRCAALIPKYGELNRMLILKSALLTGMFVAPPTLAERVATTDDLQADFEQAVPCHEIDGRKVWKGGIAYYIQSYVYDINGAEYAGEGADAVLPEDNTPETMQEFEAACAAGPTAPW